MSYFSIRSLDENNTCLNNQGREKRRPSIQFSSFHNLLNIKKENPGCWKMVNIRYQLFTTKLFTTIDSLTFYYYLICAIKFYSFDICYIVVALVWGGLNLFKSKVGIYNQLKLERNDAQINGLINKLMCRTF